MKQDVVLEIREKFADRISKFEEKSERRIYLDVAPEVIPEIARFIFSDAACRFATASGMDTPQGIEILYHFSHDASGKSINVRTLLKDKKHPDIQSITPIIRGAEWIEREMWELLGINFIGHPNMKHLLLIDDWPEGKFPLRKDK